MKNVLMLLSFSLILVSIKSIAQTSGNLEARMEWIYVEYENQGEYFGGVVVKTGVLKANQTISVTDDGNNTFSFKVKSISRSNGEQVLTQLKAGEDATVFLKTLDGKKLKQSIKGGFNLGKKANTPNTSSSGKGADGLKGDVTANFNNSIWKGSSYYGSSSYWINGNPMMKTQDPYLLLSWKAKDAPDDRQLTITFKNITAGLGAKKKDEYEIVLSGSPTGETTNSCFKSNVQLSLTGKKHSNFNLEITKWEIKGSILTISGKFSGMLKANNPLGLVKECKGDLDVVDGSFENLQVKIYNESYEQQEKQLGNFFEQNGTKINSDVQDFLNKEVNKAKKK